MLLKTRKSDWLKWHINGDFIQSQIPVFWSEGIFSTTLFFSSLLLTVQNDPKTPIKDLTSLKRVSDSVGLSDGSGPPPEKKKKKTSAYRFQCWKCLESHETKDSLASHHCLPKIRLVILLVMIGPLVD